MKGHSLEPQAAAELLKAFSHPTRLALLHELVDGPKCVTDMEELLPARQANISQHLAVLRHSKLVDYAQDGALRSHYVGRPRLVEDTLALVGRGDPAVKRTAEEIQADKEQLAQAGQRKRMARRKPRAIAKAKADELSSSFWLRHPSFFPSARPKYRAR